MNEYLNHDDFINSETTATEKEFVQPSKELVTLLQAALSAINHMGNDFYDRDELCQYCIHLPMGGDGQCGIDKDGACNFRWRLADKVEAVIKECET